MFVYVSVFPNMTVFTTGSQQSACQNCFSCAQSSVSVNQDLTSGPVLSHNYVSLLHAPPLYNSSETPEPKHLTPVSLCTDYVVIAETMGQLNLHHLNLAVVLL